MAVKTTFTTTIHIDAPPDRVWNVMSDVERWPEWTRSVTGVKKLDAGPFAVGSRARVKQPKLSSAVWRVTELQPGRSFTWVSGFPGMITTGYHAVDPAGAGSEITLEVRFEGIVAGIASRMFGNLTEEYINIEANGLKLRCES